MAEEKHRMLYQGQDPSQPVWRAQTPMEQPRESCMEPQQPPTYDDAMGNLNTLRLSAGTPDPTAASCQSSGADRRCSLSAPALLRSQLLEQLDETAAHCSQRPPQEPHMDGGEVSAMPRQQEPRRERPRLQQAHNVFALAPQPRLGASSCPIVCPACGREGRTLLRTAPSTRTHCWALWLCSIGWCCCACLYPYLVDSCYNTNHYCTVCKAYLGSHNPKDCC
ncbi:uncharacterized protein LOC6584082 [Drosophila mojavensis]|uniref:LITAF domain-containing protein n=1 Tax=Drosophila mojavensis TaxID=7230 RepID=B4L3D1_DROMO|nr:uncharacterized protein LOC6584082 [Drosophila mojavensis]EDW07059.1 uncharacterized protein Dmoj_GI15068 [Drosophila mojavensis]